MEDVKASHHVCDFLIPTRHTTDFRPVKQTRADTKHTWGVAVQSGGMGGVSGSCMRTAVLSCQ